MNPNKNHNNKTKKKGNHGHNHAQNSKKLPKNELQNPVENENPDTNPVEETKKPEPENKEKTDTQVHKQQDKENNKNTSEKVVQKTKEQQVEHDSAEDEHENWEENLEYAGNLSKAEKLGKAEKVEKALEDKDHQPVEDLDKYLDMDIRTGLSYEANKIADNIFLTRGLNDLPEPENVNCEQYQYSSCKLPSYDWMSKLDIATEYLEFPIAEVRFKNSHKDFFLLPPEGHFHVGDIVAVEASPGHDIGIISMLGLQVKRQMEHKHVKPQDVVKKLYRTARYADIEEWIATVGLEHKTMLSSRYTAWDLNLKMKVNDVEYLGDGTKAIFYYSAEERVDFRELIKILAEQFHIRIEMRQIGVRQEAARLGGIGSCGRELCCSSWLTNFQSVSTSTARTQQLSLNPQKLAGMCGKLKCCLNFEQDTYLKELKEFPSSNIQLKTKKGKCFYNKIDIFKKIVWYSYANDNSTLFAIPLDKVKQIIKMNEDGIIPEQLEDFAIVNQKKMDEGNGYSMDELKNIEGV